MNTNGLSQAMVTKVSARNHGGEVRLKAAASFAETGDIHDVVDELWRGPGAKKQTLIETVWRDLGYITGGVLADSIRKSTFSLSEPTRLRWSLMISYRIQSLLCLCRSCTTAWYAHIAPPPSSFLPPIA